MSVSISVTSKPGKEKTLWAWSVSLKAHKFGSSATSNATVGELIAIHSAITTIPEHLDIIFRTRDEKVAEIINKPRTTQNPIVMQIYAMVQRRKGFVRCILVGTNALSEEDKRAIKMLQELSGSGKPKNAVPDPPKRSSVSPSMNARGGSILRPQNKTTVKAVKRKKKREQPLTTGLEDWDDVNVEGLFQKQLPPVLCESCGMPISPLTNECGCSM